MYKDYLQNIVCYLFHLEYLVKTGKGSVEYVEYCEENFIKVAELSIQICALGCTESKREVCVQIISHLETHSVKTYLYRNVSKVPYIEICAMFA